MKILRGHNKKIVWLLIASMLLSMIPIGEINPLASYADVVGQDEAGKDIIVTGIEYAKNFEGVNISGGVFQVYGSNMTTATALFEMIGQPFTDIGQPIIRTSGYLQYKLTSDQAKDFSGRILIVDKIVTVVNSNFPTVTSIGKDIVNQDSPAPDNQQTIEGSNLMRIGTGTVTGVYGQGSGVTAIGTTMNDSSLTFTPIAKDFGYQFIRISETGIAAGTTINTVVTYNYLNSFQIYKDIGIVNLQMFPSAAARGDSIYLTSDGFNDTVTYEVYFLGGTQTVPSTANKGTSVSLSGDKKTLTVTIPNTIIDLGTKTVKLLQVQNQNKQIVGEQTVSGTFNLIDATNKPVITEFYPQSGTDSGSNVNIKGQNLLTPAYTDLYTPATVTVDSAILSTDKKTLTLNYDESAFTYNGLPVTMASRTVKVIIGAAATFEAFATPALLNGDDLFDIRTASITDALTDPQKDVVVEIKTTITAGGKTYIYDQVARADTPYTFIPSSVKPTITKISPNLVHVTTSLNMKENTLISIEGSNFMVNKWTDDNNKTHQNYPVVVIQKTTNLGTGSLILMFDKNGNEDSTVGRIYYNDGSGIKVLQTADHVDVPVDMVVLDANNKVVDGTVGNDIGNRIVLYLPKLAQIDAEASRNVKVLNPKRNSDDLGSEATALDGLSFVVEPPSPIIESVSPTIVTLAGGEEVTITGSTSIAEGAKVYIDGREVTGVTRSLDLTGNKVLLKFKAPAGRLGRTQLAVVNPLGGIAVRDFYYVQSFNSDPLIATVAPDKGTEGTLVLIGGDNFFKPDPTVTSETGMDAFRLVGSRVLLDGVEVNQYNTGSYGEIVFNTYIGSDAPLKIGSDIQGRPQAQAADYANSVILKGATGYYTLDTLFDGTVNLKGNTHSYTIRLNEAGDGFDAYEKLVRIGSVSVSDAGLIVDGESLTMITPYIVNTSTKVITGNRTRVISKNQIAVTIPRLITAGLKDVAVENPDTKRATKLKSFTYYDSPYPQPTVTSVAPNIGSVSGGYFIAIGGTNFESGSQVYIDGVLVPVADTAVNAAGTVITVKVPKYSRNLADYGTDRITVPLVVVNLNAGTFSMPKGFTYISPSKEPSLTKVQLSTGSTNGGEVVELEGVNFNFFEPFKERDGLPGYSAGDTFTNINSSLIVDGIPNTTWDDLSGLSGKIPLNPLLEAKNFANDATYMFYSQYYSSPVLPKVYFGTKQAQIVSYGNGKLTVVTPSNTAGSVDVYVVNNDSGISNKLKYSYTSSNPKVTYMNPTQGARVGQENRDIYGERLAQSLIPGYYGDGLADDDDYKDEMLRVEGLIRFADISNRKIALGEKNSGKIGGGEQAVVSLEGELSMQYNGSNDTITVNLVENGKTYTRTFGGYDDVKLLIPAGMLKSGSEYYVPDGYSYDSASYNSNTHYELFLVEVDPAAGRFYVERGYAPRVKYDNATHLNLDTPSYYSVGKVNVSVFNPDGGVAVTSYTYRNPASKPTITKIQPQLKIDAENAWMVQASVKGGITIEIKGHDFREGVKVYIDKRPMEVLDITEDATDPLNPLEVIIARVPAGILSEIGLRFPILVENPDGAIANSTDPKTLSSIDKWPIYFIYRNPLSDPVITAVTPAETSIYGDNEILITGTDFRTNCMIIVGSKGGIPVPYDSIDPRGTWVKFTTPKDKLTLGAKDIQVVNTDFGTGIKANGLKIISYPIVNTVTSEAGTTGVEWLSVEGGGKIRLTGIGFAEGAKVIFGGTRALKSTIGTTTGLTGLDKDDQYFTVTDGILATTVQFVDANTLIVTAPSVTKEKDFTITVLNADTGISDGDKTVKYSVPVPSAPLNLDAEIVNNKYIKLFGYTSSNFDYFEIYAFIGDSSISELTDDNYKDFKYLATATTEPYKITRLDGLDTMGSKDRVYLVLKAVNKYGPSSWSNIATLKYTEINDIKGGLGVEDFDGNLDVPAGQAYGAEVTAQQAVVSISAANLKNAAVVDMTGTAYSLVQNTIVNVPEAVVASNYNRVTLKMRQGQLSFYPAALNTMAFQGIARSDQMDTYANLRFEPVTTEYAGLIQRYIPRELKAFSQPYRIGTAASSNAGTTELYQRVGIMDLAITYQSTLPVGYNPYGLSLYWYDSASYRWVRQVGSVDIYNRQVSSKASLPGIYMILGPR